MIGINAKTPPDEPLEIPAPGATAAICPRPPKSLGERMLPVDWAKQFWMTMAAGLPKVHLIENPYLPLLEHVTGGWHGLIEADYRPRKRFDGVTKPNGAWLLTPSEQEAKHAVDAARRILSSPPDYFESPGGSTYFSFLELAYSHFPDWAIIHRRGGTVSIRQDLLLHRPDSETTMEAMVLGPLFQLDKREVRLWEEVAMMRHRAFMVSDLTE